MIQVSWHKLYNLLKLRYIVFVIYADNIFEFSFGLKNLFYFLLKINFFFSIIKVQVLDEELAIKDL